MLARGTDPIVGAPPQGRGRRSDADTDRDSSRDLGAGSAGANAQPGQSARPCLRPQPRAPRDTAEQGLSKQTQQPPSQVVSQRSWARGRAGFLSTSTWVVQWTEVCRPHPHPVTGTYTGPSAWIIDPLPPLHAHLATPPHGARAAIITTDSRGTGGPASISGLVGAQAGCPAPRLLSLPPESKC